MRIAAIYDIHGNLPALVAVVQAIRAEGVDQIVVGGDVVPGPMPRETLSYLLDLDIPVSFIHGNGDREVAALMRGVETEWYRTAKEHWREPVQWTAAQLDGEHGRILESWPSTYRVVVAGLGDVLFCHATPRNDTDVFTRLTPPGRLVPLFQHLGVAVVVCGHTHMQFDVTIAGVRVVNAGSVGMPFGRAGAFWLMLGPDVQLRHTAYDVQAAAAAIRRSAYPQAEQFAARSILEPPTEAEMLELFTPAPPR